MRLRQRRTFFFLAAILLGWPVTSQAEGTQRLYLGTPTRSVSWFPLFVAMKKGFFQEQGLFSEPVLMDPRVAVTALAAKEIPYITVLGSGISGAARGLSIKLIMVLGAKSHRVLVASSKITSVSELRGRTVATGQIGADPHQDLLLVLRRHGIDPKEVKVLPVGSDMNRVIALKTNRAQAMITGVPYDLLVEKDGFKQLVYVKDVMELPIMGLATHDDWIRERPQEVKKILTAILRGIAFTKANREEVLPLLKEFVGLEDLEMAGKAFDTVKDIWPVNGMPSDEGLRNVFARAGLSPSMPVEKIVNWSLLIEAEKLLSRR
ncbi:MAG: hypothetical protein A2038_03235 [Deltaproteobacteria bacterium GWA2_57_13]|nr:MAG: hypothetical protein A2038_03235 [Deltaproteobacteria bacterium GWA2_57_13]